MMRDSFSFLAALAVLVAAGPSLAQKPETGEKPQQAPPGEPGPADKAAAENPEQEASPEEDEAKAAADADAVADDEAETEAESEADASQPPGSDALRVDRGSKSGQANQEMAPPADTLGMFGGGPDDEAEPGFVSDALPGDVSPSLPLYSGVRSPGSIAFSILDLSPGEIQKPSASPPLSLTIARPLHDWDGPAVPLNLAVDLSPYWLASHSTLNHRNYVNSGFFARLYQNLTLSLATSTVGATDPVTGVQSSATSLAAGFRTGIESRCHACPQLTPLQDEYLEAVSREKLRAMDSAVAGGEQLQSFEPVTRSYKEQWLKERVRSRALEQATRQCTRKRGFAADIAFATAFSFPEQDLGDGQLSAYSTWLTLAALGDTVSAVPMARFRVDQLDRDNARSVFDLGGRLLLAVQRFAFSAEFVYRLVVDEPAGPSDDGYYLADFGVDAAVAEGIWLNLTLGKGFADLTDDELFAKTSLTFDLGERTLRVDPDATGRAR